MHFCFGRGEGPGHHEGRRAAGRPVPNPFNELLARMMEDSRVIWRATALLFVAKHLERLGDHVVNVAEMVFYLVEGTEIRHPHSRSASV